LFGENLCLCVEQEENTAQKKKAHMQSLPCTIETVFIPTSTAALAPIMQQPHQLIFSVANSCSTSNSRQLNQQSAPAAVCIQKVEDDSQYFSYIIKLERTSIVQAISFRKTQKPNTNHTKPFQIHGGLDKSNMPLLLTSCTFTCNLINFELFIA